MAKRTKEDIVRWLSLDGRGIILVGEFVNYSTKTKFQCSHGHQWNTTPSNIKKAGCPKCSGNHRPTKEEINDGLIQRGITLIGEYTNNYTKTLFECSNGHEWIATPNSVRSGCGCPVCRGHGFNPNKPAWFYILIFANFIKYGITNNLKKRLTDHKKNGVYELAYSQYYDIGHDSLNRENKIKRIYGGKFATKDECPVGYTETLPIHLLENVINEHHLCD